MRTTHFKVMHDQPDAEKIAELVRQPQPRWTAEQVAAVKKALLKD